ncbi:AzlD domain-containing protein [Paenibacillus sp. UNC451MF]|uniref:AzlD domain-containing protein n=1 Tax=Paenibacillus sp. UNC451MF TaxID=1449063 RepID=UPI00048C7AAE|nr:AzlD domain-containing protein [Paenibacillus sp. UNC451MF]
MEVRWYVLLVVVATAVVTFIPRVVPLMVLSRFELPGWAMRWLNYVPIAVMAALIGQELFIHDGSIPPLSQNLELWAAVPSFIIAVLTRSILGTVLSGVVVLMVLRHFL